MTEWSAEWALWMLPVVWQVTLLALGVFVADLLLRRVVWPQFLHGLWLLIPLRLLLPPHFTSPVALAPRADVVTTTTPETHATAWLLTWIAGVVVFGLFAVRSRRNHRRALERSAIPAPRRARRVLANACDRLGIRKKNVRLYCSDKIRSAAVYGWLRPRIVLPTELARSASDQELEHILLHEAAHVARGDLGVQALFGALNLLFWFHPLVFLARRRASALRELCCDATVASVLREETPAYRATLLRAASRLL
ncbi:MAG: M56 family metallopeptidase, partial [Planctomycetota bacterium]